MARYLGQSDHPVITDYILDIVRDAYGFLSSESCDKWFKQPGAPAHYWKHVKIYSHRRSGFSTTALKLLNEYTPSIIVTHSQQSAIRLRQDAFNWKLVPPSLEEDFNNNITFLNHIVPHRNIDKRWLTSCMRRPEERYQLIIFDGASMIEQQHRHDIEKLRDFCWQFCDLLVELG